MVVPGPEKRPPENLTHCSECGLTFDEPVTVETALEYFQEVEYASLHCDNCADDVERAGASR